MGIELLTAVSRWALPLFLLTVFLHARYRRLAVYETFVEGAQEGISLAVRLFPYVLGIFVAINIFRKSGALDTLVLWVRPLLEPLGVPGDILPLMLVRPLSGPASLGLVAEMLERYGPDSFLGQLASVVEASTDTTLYILAIYLGSVGIRKARYALPVGLLADLIGFMAAVLAVQLLF